MFRFVMIEKEYYKWINIARGIGMILVVCGHAIGDTITGERYGIVAFDVIYSFHMPLFFFLSGFCGTGVLRMKNYSQKLGYIYKKFERLMIPYFIVGIIYVPLKIIFAGEVNTTLQLNSFVIDFLLGDNPNAQLWTLYALFILSTLVCLSPMKGRKLLLLSFFDYRSFIVSQISE